MWAPNSSLIRGRCTSIRIRNDNADRLTAMKEILARPSWPYLTFANGKNRPAAACRALDKRTFADFAERPTANVDEGRAKYALARLISSHGDGLSALIDRSAPRWHVDPLRVRSQRWKRQ